MSHLHRGESVYITPKLLGDSSRETKKPEYDLIKLTRLDQNYMFYIYVEHPQDIFTLHPRMLKEITELWGKARK